MGANVLPQFVGIYANDYVLIQFRANQEQGFYLNTENMALIMRSGVVAKVARQ